MFLPRVFYSPSSRASLAAVATALLWWLSLQKIGVFALGWIAFVPLLATLNHIPQTHSRFWYGWRAGALCFALINWWLIPAIIKGGVVIGAAPPIGAALGVLSVGIIAVGHGLGVALLAALWNPRAKFFQSAPLLLPLVAALFWFGFEVMRAGGTLAHSWGALAFSQWSDVALLQSASFLGQHGLSALCVWFAASLALWIAPEYSSRVPALWRAPLLIFLLLHVWGAWRIFDYDLSFNSDTPRLSALLVQTNVSSVHKSSDGGESHFEQAETLTREYFAANGGVHLIVWPETTAEVVRSAYDADRNPEKFGDSRSRHTTRSEMLVEATQSALLTGAQGRTFTSSGGDALPHHTNRALLFTTDKNQQSSAKMRVVPFGERAPFSELLPFLNQLAPQPPIEPATSVAPLKLGDVSIGTLICFESCFPTPAKTLKAQGAQALFVLTNDEWFAGTTAPWEHAAMSTLRAVENDIPVAQSANGGYSFAVDARGRFVKVVPSNKAGTLAVKLRLR